MPSQAAIDKRIEQRKKREKAEVVAEALRPAPIERSVKGTVYRRNKRAEAILRRLKKEEKNPTVKQGRYIKKTTTKAGGISSTDASFRTQKGDTAHDLEFGRENTPKGDPYKRRTNVSPENAKVRQANIKYQLGNHIDNVPEGDRIQAQPVNEDPAKPNARARIYDRATKGALASKKDRFGGNLSFEEVDTRKGKDNTYWNAKGKKVKFDPKSLKEPLKNLAKGTAVSAIVKRLAGPWAQAAMFVDDSVKGITGKRPSKEIAKGHKKTMEKYIKERLKKNKAFDVGLRF